MITKRTLLLSAGALALSATARAAPFHGFDPEPKSVFAYSDLVTPSTVCAVDRAQTCRARPNWQPERDAVDEAAYRTYVAGLYKRPEFADFQILLPPVPQG